MAGPMPRGPLAVRSSVVIGAKLVQTLHGVTSSTSGSINTPCKCPPRRPRPIGSPRRLQDRAQAEAERQVVGPEAEQSS